MLSRFALLSILICVSCVSTHKQHMSKQTSQVQDNEVLVSVEKNSSMSTDNFVVLEYSLENTGSDYKRYESIDIEIDPALKNDVKIVVGQDLINWSEGISNKMEKDNHNFRVFVSAVAGVAGASAAYSKDPNYSKIATGVFAAGASTLAVDQFMNIRDKVKNSTKSDMRGLIPESHILSTPVSVPPNLFLKRFAVFYVKGKGQTDFRTMKLNLNGTGDTKSIAMNTRFAKEPIVGKSLTCKNSGKSIVFRSFQINCLRDCEKVHPLNQKNCEEAYSKKFPLEDE